MRPITKFSSQNIANVVSILSCQCGGAFSLGKKTLKCNNCSSEVEISRQDRSIIFEEIYKPTNASVQVFKPSTKELRADNWRIQNYKITENWIKHLPNNYQTIVDLGSGPLTNSYLLKDRNPIYVDCARFEGVDIVCNFSKKLPFKSNSIDAILCSNVLEHLPEPQIFLDEISRVIKNNGSILILVPFIIKLHQEPYDFYRYTSHALKYLVGNAGLNIKDIKAVGGFSNIFGNLFQIAIKETSNPLKLLGLKFQYLIWKVLRKLYKDDSSNQLFPQGYALILSKSLD
jgi:SAM-dependent methyltransferase